MIYTINSSQFQSYLRKGKGGAKSGATHAPGAAAAGRGGTIRNDAVVPTSA